MLTSYQMAEGDPIMQSERQAMTRDLQQAVALSIDANDIELIKLIMERQFSVLMKDLFVNQSDPMAIEDLIKARSLEAVEDYLTPMYRELENISRQYEETTISEEDRRTVDVGFGINIDGIKVGFDVKQEDIDKIAEKFGTEFKRTEKTKVMIPHSIAVSFFASNQVSTLNRLAFSIQVENAKISSYSRSKIIPASMAVSPDFLGGVVPDLTYGVPVGTAFCSFVASVDPPFGYRWIEEGSAWPNMAILGGLAGQLMPNINDMLVGATQHADDVGSIWLEGYLDVAGSEINGSSFGVSGATLLGATTTAYGRQGRHLGTNATTNPIAPSRVDSRVPTATVGFNRGLKAMESTV